MRASAAAILSVIFNLVGTGLGPVFVGWLSDVYGAHAFALGDYQAMCPGGHPLPGADVAIGQACAAAASSSVRLAITTTAVVYFWAALHFYLAGRSLRDDITSEALPPTS